VRFECRLFIGRSLDEDPLAKVGLLGHTMRRPLTKERRTTLTRQSAFSMTAFLLEQGADLNEKVTPDGSKNVTVWQQSLQEYYKDTKAEGEEGRYLWRKAKEMLRYGADGAAEEEVTSSEKVVSSTDWQEYFTLSARACLLSHASEDEITSLIQELGDIDRAKKAEKRLVSGIVRMLPLVVVEKQVLSTQFGSMFEWTIATIIITVMFVGTYK
jgi:hypothetical protein